MCALLALLTGMLYARFAAQGVLWLGARIREAEYARVQQYAFSNLDHFEASSLVTRMTTDVTVLQNAINSGFRPIVRGPVMLVLGVGLSLLDERAALAGVFVHAHSGRGAVLHHAQGSTAVFPPAGRGGLM